MTDQPGWLWSPTTPMTPSVMIPKPCPSLLLFLDCPRGRAPYEASTGRFRCKGKGKVLRTTKRPKLINAPTSQDAGDEEGGSTDSWSALLNGSSYVPSQPAQASTQAPTQSPVPGPSAESLPRNRFRPYIRLSRIMLKHLPPENNWIGLS